jgi:hypothetical protein
MNVKDLLISTIEGLGFPIYQQGSLGENEPYPASFFTFWNNTAEGAEFYDNEEHSITWNFDLNFYSIDPTLVNSVLMESKSLLKQAGFIVTGAGHDLISDEHTHTGRGITVWKIEKLGGN